MKSLHIKDLETGEIVHSVAVKHERTYEKVLSGLLHRIDTARFFVDDSEFCDPTPDVPDELKPKSGAQWKVDDK